MKFPLLATTLAVALAAPAFGQTVSVKKDGTGDFNSISAALASFNPDPNTSVDNIIQINDTELYQESITIETPVVIEATGTEHVTVCLESNGAGTRENGGIVVNLPSSLSTGTVVLRNLTILPAVNTTDIRLRSAIENINNNVFLWIDNCLICPNDGSDNPIVTDGYTSRIYNIFPGTEANPNPDVDPNIVQFGDKGIILGRTGDGIYEGAGVELLFEDSIISHFRNDFSVPAPKPTPYCIQMNSSYVYDQEKPYPTEFRLTRVEGNSAISFSLIGLHATGDVQFKADEGKRIRMRGFADEAIHFVGPAQNFRNIEDAIIEGSSRNLIWDQGFGDVRMTMKHCLVYYCGRHVIMVRKPNNDVAAGLLTIEDSTLVGGRDINSYHAFRIEAGTELDVVFKDSIIGGKLNLPTSGVNVISLGSNTCTLIGTALITEGPFALRGLPFSLGTTSEVIGTPTTNADPMFIDVTFDASDPQHPDWLDPSPDYMNVQNIAYAEANSESDPLGGGALYVGPSSQVADWTIY